MKKLPRRPVVLAVTVALLAGIVGGSADAVPAQGQTQTQAAGKDPAAQARQAAEEDPTPDEQDQQRLLDQLQRDLIADIAGSDREDDEVRAAARNALRKIDAGDKTAAQQFFDHDQQEARAQAKKRKDEADAANRAQIEPLAGTGGPAFRAAVDRALRGDARAREEFLAFGRDIAAEEDRRHGAYEKELRDRRRAHVQVAADRGGPEVSKAAKAALAQGDAAIQEFLRTGYLAAAQRDADNRENELAELERQRKEAEAASDLAKRTARAMAARRNLLAAHADGVKALERTANDMTSAANASREAARALVSDQAGHTYHPELYQRAKDEAVRQVRYAVADAQAAQAAAAGARTQADILVQNQMPHGTQWAKVVQGMAASAEAAKLAAETASHAIDAIAAEAAATDANEKAKAHAENAKRWRQNAESHAASAAQLAAAAKEQALAAADAALRAKQARADAEAALLRAQAHAANVKQARGDAERERDTAAAKRAEAERWREEAARKRQEAEAKQAEAARQRAVAQQEARNAAAKRQEAEAQQRIAAQKRQDAQGQEQIAAAAASDARAQEKIAMDADAGARHQESLAHQARENAAEITRSAETTEKKASALEALAQRVAGMAEVAQDDKDKARAAATQARTDATNARTAATTAQGDAAEAGVAAERSHAAAIAANGHASRSRAAADAAQAAAAAARAAANEAEAAAAKSRAAANEAQAAAARSNEAANRAESEAAAVHAEALKANAAAEEATAQEARAADNARKAVELANQAAWESAKTLDAARRTQDEANASAVEAATAATQAGIATRAAAAATRSSSGIANPANTAIDLTAPFAASDVDADFAAMVAARAQDIGDSQVQAANRAAADANEQARQAAEAAQQASGEVAPAYQAASAAANSAAEAARSAAAAQVSAAAAAVDAAAARAAAAQANAVDALAQADAQAARAAANQAAADAALAGRAADQAEADARAARAAADNATRAANEASAAASRAERDAAAAMAAANQAAIDAEEARQAAQRAQQHANDAEQAATNAENYAKDAEQAAANAQGSAKDVAAMLIQIQDQLRRENEERQQREIEEAINDDSQVPALTAEEEQALREAKGQAAVDDYRRARADANKSMESYIIDNGGQIILDLIGFTDAKKCFMEGDFIACVMTVLNALPVLKLIRVLTQIPDAVSATVRIVKGLRSFKNVVVAGRKLAAELREFARQLIKCKSGRAALGGPVTCPVDLPVKHDPNKPPRYDPLPDPYPIPLPFPEPGPGQEDDEDRNCDQAGRGWADNYRMQNFTYNGIPASKATGGTACIIRIVERTGTPDTPVGYDPLTMDKGHLIAASFTGSNHVQNIVPLYIAANTPVMNFDVEGKIRQAVHGGERVLLRVVAEYTNINDALPARVNIKAWGMKSSWRCIALVINVPNPPRATCQ